MCAIRSLVGGGGRRPLRSDFRFETGGQYRGPSVTVGPNGAIVRAWRRDFEIRDDEARTPADHTVEAGQLPDHDCHPSRRQSPHAQNRSQAPMLRPRQFVRAFDRRRSRDASASSAERQARLLTDQLSEELLGQLRAPSAVTCRTALWDASRLPGGSRDEKRSARRTFLTDVTTTARHARSSVTPPRPGIP